MGRYITWEDIVDRYPLIAKGNFSGSSEASSAYIFYGESELDGLLAPAFTIPFSSNNVTAKDLAIDLSYCRMANFKIEERKEFKKEIMDKINMLKDGAMSMLTNSNDTVSTLGQSPTWSSTKDYHPVFGHGNDIYFEVDSGLTTAEQDARD